VTLNREKWAETSASPATMADVIGSSAVFDDGVSMPRRTGLAIGDDPLSTYDDRVDCLGEKGAVLLSPAAWVNPSEDRLRIATDRQWFSADCSAILMPSRRLLTARPSNSGRGFTGV
jgi:hypothetical protein